MYAHQESYDLAYIVGTITGWTDPFSSIEGIYKWGYTLYISHYSVMNMYTQHAQYGHVSWFTSCCSMVYDNQDSELIEQKMKKNHIFSSSFDVRSQFF